MKLSEMTRGSVCPKCGAPAGEPCIGVPEYEVHPERIKARMAEKKRKDEDFSQAAARIVKEATENH
jgi:hypothetical protein